MKASIAGRANNLTIIKSLYAFFSTQDRQQIRELFAPGIHWEQMHGFPNGGVYRGADAIFTNVFDGFKHDWQSWKAVVTEYLDAGDDVIAIGYYEGSHKATNFSLRAKFAHRYTLNDGRITRFVQYTDTWLVAKAIGK